jgi:dTDP-4-dehydrorhamnose reductase
MQKVLILGHKGMLGRAVHLYFTTKKNDFVVLTINERWGTEDFKKILQEADVEVIINCIGLIPQKKPSNEEYERVNVDLPIFLETLGKKIIHPSTDCEFSGNIDTDIKYSKQDVRDAEDVYGKSKAKISVLIEKSFTNTKIIRTSIIGHELNSHLSLLDWFLFSEEAVNGYINHYWNGITTLEWAKLCAEIINNWDKFPVLNQYGTLEIRSKYVLLNEIKHVYNKNIKINNFKALEKVNKCLESDKHIKPIREQLQELKSFYKK